jgi:hypothetical protein
MAYFRLALKPGIDKQNTEYGAEGGWIDSDYVRFRYGLPEKMGGWTEFNQAATYLVGNPSNMLSWSNLDGVPYLAVGTQRKLYVFTGGAWYDITPVRTIKAGLTFNTVAGSTTVTVTHTGGHSSEEGDFVRLSGVTGDPGGIPSASLVGEFEIQQALTGTTYTIVSPVAATSTATAAGGATGTYDINIGSDVTFFDFGWGVGGFGISPFGEPVPGSGTLALSSRSWQFDTFGENLIASINNGPVYQWSPTSNGVGVRAQLIAGAPTRNNYSLVSTPDRHLVVFGTEGTIGDPNTFDPMFVRFSNQEDVNTFVESATNTAGGQRLSDGNKIVGAIRSRGQILIFTDNSLHAMQYLGPPFTFGFQQLGANCGIIGPHAGVDVDGMAIWMGPEDFFMFDGSVKKIPCTVQDYVFKNINLVQGTKVFAAINSLFNEVTWFYCTSDSTEINRFVTLNYLERVWSTGSMARTAWQDAGIYNLPLATEYFANNNEPTISTIYGLTAGRSLVYIQENGFNANGQPIVSYIQSGYFDIGDGDNLMYMKRFVPDFKNQVGDLTVNLLLRAYPQSTAVVGSLDPYIITPATSKVDTRARGRQISLKITSDDLNTNWRYGTLRIDIQPDGLR